MKQVIKCGHLFSTATGKFEEKMNIFIDGAKITEVSQRPASEEYEVIDLSGKYGAARAD